MNALAIKADVDSIQERRWNERRVITYDDIARVHHIKPAMVRKAFSRHKDELFEGEDYFTLAGKDARQILGDTGCDKTSQSGGTQTAKLFTESGYFVLACTFKGKEAALIRRTLVNSYFHQRAVKEHVPTPGMKELQNHVGRQNCILNSIESRIKDIAEVLAKPPAPVKAEEPVQETDIEWTGTRRPDEVTLTMIAERCGWRSVSGNPHTMFVAHILRNLGIKTHRYNAYEDEYSRCVYTPFHDETKIEWFLKPAGIEKLYEWCEQTDYGRTLRREERYQRPHGIHMPGDIKSVYYLVESPRRYGKTPSRKKYILGDF